DAGGADLAVGNKRIVRRDHEPEPARPLTDGPCDPAEADESERPPAQAAHRSAGAEAPAAARGVPGQLDDAPLDRQYECERVVSHFVDAVVRHARNCDPALRCGPDVDVVDADS